MTSIATERNSPRVFETSPIMTERTANVNPKNLTLTIDVVRKASDLFSRTADRMTDKMTNATSNCDGWPVSKKISTFSPSQWRSLAELAESRVRYDSVGRPKRTFYNPSHSPISLHSYLSKYPSPNTKSLTRNYGTKLRFNRTEK